jgi:hypothetical protein
MTALGALGPHAAFADQAVIDGERRTALVAINPHAAQPSRLPRIGPNARSGFELFWRFGDLAGARWRGGSRVATSTTAWA